MFVTDEVLKLDRSNVFKLLQLLNIEEKSVTFDVPKFDTSREDNVTKNNTSNTPVKLNVFIVFFFLSDFSSNF